ncbi:MAG: hypothetical protein WHF31_08070 [Candidatus Dehalobacter alkaniphilus]|uniref:hypothetical protein n=1 Tax=Dehalobacter sp. DCA TaxID=1147129 RepID=UPI00028A6786|nr:hypothetical protein [Dehalobacter sp. DCA]AFV04958.1 hypothetical protein DCF50_p953 [Dehalobacter sp. CF]
MKGRASHQTVTSSESCRVVNQASQGEKEEPSLALMDEGHGRCKELGAASKNLSA